MNNERPNFGGWSGPWGPMPAPVEQWFSMVRAWTDAWSAFLPGGQAGPCQNPWLQAFGMGATSGCPPPPSAPSPSVTVRIVSTRPAEVTATLMPGAERLPLVADVPNLHGISIDHECGRVRVTLHVAAGQVPGHYRGVIKSEGRVVGDLAVTLSEAPAA